MAMNKNGTPEKYTNGKVKNVREHQELVWQVIILAKKSLVNQIILKCRIPSVEQNKAKVKTVPLNLFGKPFMLHGFGDIGNKNDAFLSF